MEHNKSPEINSHLDSQSMTLEGIYSGEMTASSINDVGKSGQIQAKINSKWIKTSM